MNIIKKHVPHRLAVYGFHNDNGGLPAALTIFTALLGANYHPSLTSTTCVNGIYSLTLVELPSNELDTFRAQQLRRTILGQAIKLLRLRQIQSTRSRRNH